MIAYADAVPEDGPELDAMARATWLETFRHSASAEDIARYLAGAYGADGELRRDLGDPGHAFRIAREAGRIVGYAKLGAPRADYAEPGALQLSQLYVVPNRHGAGIADGLMDWTTDTARARGATALLLTVWEHNPRAIRFYRKRGWVHVGDYAFRTGGQLDRDLILRLAL